MARSILILGLLCLVGVVRCDRVERENAMLNKILENVQPSPQGLVSRPKGTNVTDGPVIVHVNSLIRSINKIDDKKMEYNVQITLRQEWLDKRLMYDDANGQLNYLTLLDFSKIWVPDLFFTNEKEGHFHNIIKPNSFLRIYPDGRVLYSTRLSLTLACGMDLKFFPMDTQVCGIRMASYGFTMDDLVFVWKDGYSVQVVSNLHLPLFTLTKYQTDYCDSKTNTGAYSCLKVDLFFRRDFSYYIMQIYIPCCMLVIVSWVSFWIDRKAVTARVLIAIATLLTMAVQVSNVNTKFPIVSYTKAIDVWTGFCMTFVFATLLEIATVNYLSKSGANCDDDKSAESENVNGLENGANHQEDNTMNHTDAESSKKMLPSRIFSKTWLQNHMPKPCYLDVFSRIIFPLAFALFNLIYWTTYTSGRD